MILMLDIHFTRVSDLVTADHIITTPPTAPASATGAAVSSHRLVIFGYQLTQLSGFGSAVPARY